MRQLFLAVCLGLVPGLGQAQVPCTSPTPQTVPPTFTCHTGVARTVAWDHQPAPVDGQPDIQPSDVFRLFVDGVQVGIDIPARIGTSISVQFGATLPAGTYAVAVSTVRPGAGIPEARSTPLTLVLIPPPPPGPPPPTNLRIVEVITRLKDIAGNIIWTHTAEMVVPAQ